MSKLNPPILEGKIPAQFGNYLRIPFSMNRAVSLTSVLKMGLIIKTISTGLQIVSNLIGTVENDYQKNIYYAIFDIKDFVDSKKIIPGQFYQVQICYISENENKQYDYGYYSTLSVMKYTKEPRVSILGLEENYFKNKDFIGEFFSEDSSEKVYSYEFILTDSNENIIDTSGLQLHNSQSDTRPGESIDIWSFSKDLNEYEAYYLIYKVITNNNLILSSDRYKILQTESVPINFSGNLITELNIDEAYVSLYLEPIKNQILSGNYIVSRTDSNSNYSNWEIIYDFSLESYTFGDQGKILIWEDYTCQHGISYQYSLQAYNSYGLYSERKLNNEKIKIDFEDIFLFDGERQLKIQFNPKISSFKTNILETKTNTLGGKYPFIFRNGIVDYKEFQLSGLISFLMDSSENFLQGIRTSELFQPRDKTPSEYWIFKDFYTNLNYENIYCEKIFREEVFKWLTNGKPKLFRSPTEGNFLIQLMNVSMTPNDTLGRMLYTFNSTACEVDDCNLLTLSKYGFNNKVYTSFDKRHISIAQIILNEDKLLADKKTIKLPQLGFNAFITNAYPGSRLTLWFSDGDYTTIEIGKTGNYYVLAKDKNIIKISFENDLCLKYIMKLTYCYYSNIINNFSNIKNILVKDTVSQFIGETDLNEKLTLDETILQIYSLEIKPRPIIEVYEEKTDVGSSYYLDKQKIYSLSSFDDFSKDIIFKIYSNSEFDGSFDIFDCNLGKRIYKNEDGSSPILDFSIESNIIENKVLDLSKIVYNKNLDQPSINSQIKNEFNSNFYLKSTSDTIYLKNLDTLTIDSDGIEDCFSLSFGNGIMANICYQLRTVIYDNPQEEENL